MGLSFKWSFCLILAMLAFRSAVGLAEDSSRPPQLVPERDISLFEGTIQLPAYLSASEAKNELAQKVLAHHAHIQNESSVDHLDLADTIQKIEEIKELIRSVFDRLFGIDTRGKQLSSDQGEEYFRELLDIIDRPYKKIHHLRFQLQLAEAINQKLNQAIDWAAEKSPVEDQPYTYVRGTSEIVFEDFTVSLDDFPHLASQQHKFAQFPQKDFTLDVTMPFDILGEMDIYEINLPDQNDTAFRMAIFNYFTNDPENETLNKTKKAEASEDPAHTSLALLKELAFKFWPKGIISIRDASSIPWHVTKPKDNGAPAERQEAYDKLVRKNLLTAIKNKSAILRKANPKLYERHKKSIEDLVSSIEWTASLEDVAELPERLADFDELADYVTKRPTKDILYSSANRNRLKNYLVQQRKEIARILKLMDSSWNILYKLRQALAAALDKGTPDAIIKDFIPQFEALNPLATIAKIIKELTPHSYDPKFKVPCGKSLVKTKRKKSA